MIVDEKQIKQALDGTFTSLGSGGKVVHRRVATGYLPRPAVKRGRPAGPSAHAEDILLLRRVVIMACRVMGVPYASMMLPLRGDEWRKRLGRQVILLYLAEHSRLSLGAIGAHLRIAERSVLSRALADARRWRRLLKPFLDEIERRIQS